MTHLCNLQQQKQTIAHEVKYISVELRMHNFLEPILRSIIFFRFDFTAIVQCLAAFLLTISLLLDILVWKIKNINILTNIHTTYIQTYIPTYIYTLGYISTLMCFILHTKQRKCKNKTAKIPTIAVKSKRKFSNREKYPA